MTTSLSAPGLHASRTALPVINLEIPRGECGAPTTSLRYVIICAMVRPRDLGQERGSGAGSAYSRLAAASRRRFSPDWSSTTYTARK